MSTLWFHCPLKTTVDYIELDLTWKYIQVSHTQPHLHYRWNIQNAFLLENFIYFLLIVGIFQQNSPTPEGNWIPQTGPGVPRSPPRRILGSKQPPPSQSRPSCLKTLASWLCSSGLSAPVGVLLSKDTRQFWFNSFISTHTQVVHTLYSMKVQGFLHLEVSTRLTVGRVKP